MSNDAYDGNGHHSPQPLHPERLWETPKMGRDEAELLIAADAVEGAAFRVVNAANYMHDKDQRRLRKYRDQQSRTRKARHEGREREKTYRGAIHRILFITNDVQSDSDAPNALDSIRAVAYRTIRDTETNHGR